MKCKRCKGKGYELQFSDTGLPLRKRCLVCKGTGKQPDFKFPLDKAKNL